MSIFEDITLAWNGEEYIVEANNVMRLIAKIEDEITIRDLLDNPKPTRIAQAYSAALKHAGASASAEEVYGALFDKKSGAHIQDTVGALLIIMMPPSSYQPQGKPEAKTEK